MKLSLALPVLAVGAMAAPSLVQRGGNSDGNALRLAENLPAIKAQTASGQEITLIQLEDGVYDPATGEFVAKDQVIQAAADSGNAQAIAETQGGEDNAQQKRTLGLIFDILGAAFGGRRFGGYQVNDVTNIYNNYNRWGYGPWTVRPHPWCGTCVSYAGDRGGYAVIDTQSRRRVFGPQGGYWGHRW